MNNSTIRFGEEKDWEVLAAGLDPSADEEDRKVAVTAFGNLAQAAAQAETVLEAEDLAELIVSALQLEMAAGDGSGADILGALECLSDKLNENREAVAVEVRGELAAFRYAVSLWDDLCSDLKPLHPAPYVVREAAEAFLDSLDVLSRSLEVVDRWVQLRTQETESAENRADSWLGDLQKSLKEAVEDAVGRIQGSGARERLWSLSDRAVKLGRGDLLPPLAALLAGRAKRLAESRDLVPGKGTIASFDQLLGHGVADMEDQPEWADYLSTEIMRLAERGLLSRIDLEAARKAVAEAPARWTTAYRRLLQQNGFQAPVFLVRNDRGIWTAPEILQVTPEEVREAVAQLPGTARAALTSGEEGSSMPVVLRRGDKLRPAAQSSLLVLPDEVPVEGLALASHELHLAGSRLLLFGDAQGLWCMAWEAETQAEESSPTAARWYRVGEEAYGNLVCFPLFQAGEEYGPYEIKRFRPGPMRAWLRSRYKNIDRVYSPRAYMLTVGESLLRKLLGWDFRECTARLNRAAWEAGVRSYSELRSSLVDACDGVLPRWIQEMETTQEVLDTGASTLGELVTSWPDLTPKDLDKQRQILGAEIDTLMSLPEEGGPLDGDIFVLIPTDTATSILCALLIGRWLHERFPDSDLRIKPCEALKQREPLRRSNGEGFESRPDLSMDALERTLNPVVKELLVEDAADPTFLISGGVKWVTLPMLELSRDLRVACVYKFEPIGGKEVAPVVFRWDAMTEGTHPRDRGEPKRTALPAGQPAPEISEAGDVDEPTSGKPCLVISVGISLLSKYRREKGLKRGIDRVEAGELVRWVREMPEDEQWRSCVELTGVKAWTELIHTDASNIAVALIQTASDDGRVCGKAVEVLLKEQGVDALRRPEWEVLDLTDVTDAGGKEQVLQIVRCILSPVGQCLDDLSGDRMRPDVLSMGGQTLTAAMIQIAAANKGYRVFLAPEAAGGEMPTLWPFPTVPVGSDLPIPIRDVGSAWD